MKTIYWTLCWVLALGLFPQYINAQEGDKALRKVVKIDGWIVPGRNEFKTVLKEHDYQVEGVTVHVKTFSTKPELFTDLEGYSLGKDGELRMRAHSCVVRDFDSYEVNGKTFGYVVHFNYASIGKDGTRYYTFANSLLAYVDEDGDGNYETRYDISSSRPPLKLPDWIKSIGTKASSNNSFNRTR